jgi:hypothetical protein
MSDPSNRDSSDHKPERRPLEFSDYALGAKSFKAGCIWLTVVLFLLLGIYAGRDILFK